MTMLDDKELILKMAPTRGVSCRLKMRKAEFK